MNLKELAERHSVEIIEGTYEFTLDQLRALITEAVGIVQGEPVAHLFPESEARCSGMVFKGGAEEGDLPLHHNDMERLK